MLFPGLGRAGGGGAQLETGWQSLLLFTGGGNWAVWTATQRSLKRVRWSHRPCGCLGYHPVADGRAPESVIQQVQPGHVRAQLRRGPPTRFKDR